MKKNDFKIVFMGTPDFSVTILNGLLDHHFSIVGVVTTADKPAGRGQKLSESAVKKFSYEKNILFFKKNTYNKIFTFYYCIFINSYFSEYYFAKY